MVGCCRGSLGCPSAPGPWATPHWSDGGTSPPGHPAGRCYVMVLAYASPHYLKGTPECFLLFFFYISLFCSIHLHSQQAQCVTCFTCTYMVNFYLPCCVKAIEKLRLDRGGANFPVVLRNLWFTINLDVQIIKFWPECNSRFSLLEILCLFISMIYFRKLFRFFNNREWVRTIRMCRSIENYTYRYIALPSSVMRHQHAPQTQPRREASTSSSSSIFLNVFGENCNMISDNFSLSSSVILLLSSSCQSFSFYVFFALCFIHRSVWIGGNCAVLSFRFYCRRGSYCGHTTCPPCIYVCVCARACFNLPVFICSAILLFLSLGSTTVLYVTT